MYVRYSRGRLLRVGRGSGSLLMSGFPGRPRKLGFAEPERGAAARRTTGGAVRKARRVYEKGE
jgi:hypothetical protein